MCVYVKSWSCIDAYVFVIGPLEFIGRLCADLSMCAQSRRLLRLHEAEGHAFTCIHLLKTTATKTLGHFCAKFRRAHVLNVNLLCH